MHTENPPASDAGTVTANPESIFAITPAAVDYLTEPTGKPMWWGQFSLWILIGLSSGALLGAAYLYGVHVGESEFKTVARPAAVSESQASPPLVATAPEPAPSVPSAAPVQSSATSVSGGAPADAQQTEYKPALTIPAPAAGELSARLSDQRAEQALEAGKSELAAASSYLNGDNGARDSSKAVRLLWAAVGHGNSEAEVILAELYVKGDGVPKNCEQGRVLLLAAAKSGDPQAKVKLNELKTNGCP
jgi:hypothetical protein